MNQDDMVIVDYARTPIGAMSSSYKNTPAPSLAATCINSNLLKTGLNNEISEVMLGCVLPAGIGQSPARQAIINSQLSNEVRSLTINKVCGSGMKACMLATNYLSAAPHAKNVVIAGGMENMSRAPHLLKGVRQGYKYGHNQVIDHMAYDGLEDPYNNHASMGMLAENTAKKYKLSKEEQDDYTILSLNRALQAKEHGYFDDEMVNVEGSNLIHDELIDKFNPNKIKSLRSAFSDTGTISAASASKIADGAATICIMRNSRAIDLGIKPIARFIGQSSTALDPRDFTEAPIGALQLLETKKYINLQDVDLFEINEAFAVVPIIAAKTLNLNLEKINVSGGALTLGHPIGASGARIICTLLSNMKRLGKRYGVATTCIGGGEATACALELIVA